MKKSHEKNWFDIIHKYLVAFLRLVIAFGILLELFEALWMNAAIAAGILLLTFLPTIFASRVQVEIPPEFEVLTVAFIFASLFLGETREFYSKFWWWDISLHTTSGVLLGILGFLLVYVLNETPRVDQHMRPGFVAFFAVWLIAASDSGEKHFRLSTRGIELQQLTDQDLARARIFAGPNPSSKPQVSGYDGRFRYIMFK